MLGDRLGKWVIFKELGRGGMGRVFLAQEELTGRQAAIKVLAGELAQEIGFLHRFQREIEALSKLEHPNIVRFFESGCENGHYFYAMEYIEGASLEQIVEEHGRLPWRDVLAIALQITPALRHVHDHGIIHRDLKPSNLLRDAKGHIKLTDFGIAKVFASTHLTATGGIVGTAEYLSPEQAAGKVVGKRSDLYSLGCVLYMLLTGRAPFAGTSYVELLHKHRYGVFDRPQKYAIDLPYEVDELVCQLLEKDPEKRPRDALVFYKQLESICGKLDRQSARTSADNRDIATKAENRTEKVSMEALPGPATMMSRLVRAELDAQQQGGPIARLFNRPIVLVMILAGCIGVLAWGFWPPSAEALYHRGAQHAESENPVDMKRAREEFDELDARFPEHPYKQDVAAFRKKLDAAKNPTPSEAQRFFQQGELLHKQGNPAAARDIWRNVVTVFGDVEAERDWVEKARRGLSDIDRANLDQDRFKSARAALERANDYKKHGRLPDAERIWTGLEQLYRNDPAAGELLEAVRTARGK